jgi:tetratricopeptide (TPR) repeat protein
MTTIEAPGLLVLLAIKVISIAMCYGVTIRSKFTEDLGPKVRPPPALRKFDTGEDMSQKASFLSRMFGRLKGSSSTEPCDLRAWLRKGSDLMKLGRAKEALEAFDQALQINQVSREAWLGRGEALRALGRTAHAETSLRNARELESGGGTFMIGEAADGTGIRIIRGR